MIPLSKPIITKKAISEVMKVLKSGMIVQGPKVKELEDRLAKYCKTKYAIAVNSGTAALHCALYALGVKTGDEVITTPFTFVATANAILMQGATVKFVDIDEESFCIDPKKIEKAITKKTKAIIAVSLFGRPYDQKINKIAKKYNLKVIDDAAQSIGAKIGKKMAGNFADISTFSLYATKNIMSAEGGMITTNNPTWAELCKRFRHHGQSEQTKYEYYDLGYNYRMTDIHAVIGIDQLENIEKYTKQRINNAKILNEGLKNIHGIITPKTPINSRHVFHQYTIKITDDFPLTRDEFKEQLTKNGIGNEIYYPKPLHLQPHFKRLGYKKGQFPVSEKIAKQVLSLPIHPSITQKDLIKIINLIKTLSQ